MCMTVIVTVTPAGITEQVCLPVYRKTITLTPTQILAFGGNAIVPFIAAPGAGKMIYPIDLSLSLAYGGIAYSTNTNANAFDIFYGEVYNTTPLCVPGTPLVGRIGAMLAGTTNAMHSNVSFPAAVKSTTTSNPTNYINKAINIIGTTTAPTGGNSPVVIDFIYIIKTI